MKYLFFRDLKHESNHRNGKSFHAAGIVDEVYCDLINSNPSGKDLAVSYFDPFTASIERHWRALDEVELFEATDEWEYNLTMERYNEIENKH